VVFVDLASISWVGFLVPFLRSIFAPFLAKSLRAICLFYGTFSMSMVVWALFLGGFLTVHLTAIFISLGPPGARWLTGHCPLVAYQVVADLACGLVFTPSTSCGLSRGLIMLPGYT
jgi:hypothetical protein